MNNKVIDINNVTKLDKYGNVIQKESFEYNLVDSKTGNISNVSKDEFLKAGSKRGMDHNSISINSDNKKIVAKF